MKYSLFIGLVVFLSAGCGIHVTSDPVAINHTVTLDLSKVDAYFQEICEANYPKTDVDYLEKVSVCKSKMITGLLSMAGKNGT